MPNRQELILKRLLEEGQKTAAYFRGLSAEHLAQTVYRSGPAWRARDLMAHLASTERNIGRLLRNVARGGPGTPEGFDIDAFNAAETAALQAMTLDELLQQFEAARAETIRLVQALSEADLDREGRHPFLGQTRLEEMLKLLYRHTMLHERDARKAIETGYAIEPTAH